MVLINALVAGLFLGQGVLGAAMPRDLSTRTIIDKSQVDTFLNSIVGKRAVPKMRRQEGVQFKVKPIKFPQFAEIFGSDNRDTAVKRNAASAGFALTDKERLIYGLAGGMHTR